MALGLIRIIVNPISGRGHDPRFIAELVRHLTLRGFTVDLQRTERAGHAAELARAVPDDAHCILSVGGDGTHREVLTGLVGRPVPACIVPSGTENVLGRTFGFLGSLRDVILRVQRGRPVALDVGLASGHPFVLFSGAGFDAAVTREVHRKRRGAIRRSTYYGVIARMLWKYRFPPMAVTVDGRLLADDAAFVLVANVPRYADGLRVAPEAIADDGLLDVVCFRAATRWHFLRAYLLAYRGRHLGDAQVASTQGRRVEVICKSEALPVQVDGDAVLTTPVTYTVMPKAVRLLVAAEALTDP